MTLCWDDFCSSPEHGAMRVCDFIGVEYDSSAIKPSWPVHHIRGNSAPGGDGWADRPKYDKCHREFTDGLTIRREPDLRWKKVLSAHQQGIVVDNTKDTLRRLECRSATT